MDRVGGEWEIRRPLVRVPCGGVVLFLCCESVAVIIIVIIYVAV